VCLPKDFISLHVVCVMACRSRVLLECLLLSVVANITCGMRKSDALGVLLDLGQGGVGASNGQSEDRAAEYVNKSHSDLISNSNVTYLNSSATSSITNSSDGKPIAKPNITDLNSSAMVGTRFDALHLGASMILLSHGTGMVDVFALLEGAMEAVGLGAGAADLGQGGGMMVLGGHAKKVKGWEKAHHLGGVSNFIGWAGLAAAGYDTYTAGRDLLQAWRGGQANGCELTVHGVHLTVAGAGLAAGLLGQFCLNDHTGTIAGAAAAGSGLLWSAVNDKLLDWCRDGKPEGGQAMDLPVGPDGRQMTLQQATQLAASSAYAPVPRGFAAMGARLNPVQTAFGFGQSPVVGGAPLVGLRYTGSVGSRPIAIPGVTRPVATYHKCPPVMWRFCHFRTLQCTPAGCQWVMQSHPC